MSATLLRRRHGIQKESRVFNKQLWVLVVRADSPLQPTGRTVVFPNSVVFTGSFFKHPRGEAAG
jgi:hypothetical protein